MINLFHGVLFYFLPDYLQHIIKIFHNEIYWLAPSENKQETIRCATWWILRLILLHNRISSVTVPSDLGHIHWAVWLPSGSIEELLIRATKLFYLYICINYIEIQVCNLSWEWIKMAPAFLENLWHDIISCYFTGLKMNFLWIWKISFIK